VPPGVGDWLVTEPLWVDLRWAHHEPDVSLRNPSFRDAVASLAAAVHDIPKDELIGEDIRQHRRTLRLARAAVTGLALLTVAAVVGAWVAVSQRNTAREQTRLATVRQLAAVAVANVPTHLDVAQRVAAEAYHRQRTPEAESALLQAVTASPRLVRLAVDPSEITTLRPTTTAQIVVTGDAEGRVMRWRLQTGHGEVVASLPKPVTAVAADGPYVAAGDLSGNVVISGRGRRLHAPGPVVDVAVDSASHRVATVSGSGFTRSKVAVWDFSTGRTVGAATLDFTASVLALRNGGQRLLVGDQTGRQRLLSAATLQQTGADSPSLTPANTYMPAYSADRRYFGFYKFGMSVTQTRPGQPGAVESVSRFQMRRRRAWQRHSLSLPAAAASRGSASAAI
jgi:hypothetical protein